MAAKYRSTREALAWLFSCSRGRGFGLNPLVHAHEPRGAAHRGWLDLAELHRLAFSAEVGLRRDTVAFSDLHAWATEQIPYHALCGRARSILRALRREMVRHGLIERMTPPPVLETVEADVEILRKLGDGNTAKATPANLRTVRVR